MAERMFEKILAPVGFSACSEEAFRTAMQLARVFSADVLLLHVIDTKSLNMLNELSSFAPFEAMMQL